MNVDAKTRRVACMLIVLMLPSLLPAADARSGTHAVWWGPTGMADGWHVRIPYAVTNPSGRDVTDATVGHDIDLAKALLNAGWAASIQGGAARPQSFELDPDSIRVVEYRALGTGTSLDGIIVGEVASRTHLGYLDTPGNYQPSSSPDIHVEWVAPGTFRAGATRYFAIYIESLTHGDIEPTAYGESELAPLESRYAPTRGTVLYGVGKGVVIVALDEDTTVHVDAYQGDRPVLVTSAAGGSFKNPMRLARGERIEVPISDTPTFVRVRADRPVIARATGDPAGAVPSVDGNLLGTSFRIDAGAGGYFAVAPHGSAIVKRARSDGSGASEIALSPGRPAAGFGPIDATPGPEVVRSDSPILLFHVPVTPGKTQFAASTGASIGTRLYGLPLGASLCETCDPTPPCRNPKLRYSSGDLLVATFETLTHFRGRDIRTAQMRLPLDPAGRVSDQGAPLEPGRAWRGNVQPTDLCPLIIHTTDELRATAFSQTDRIIAFGGANPLGGTDRLLTSVTGTQAMRFLVMWDVTVIAMHDGTRIDTTRDGKRRELPGMGASDLAHIDASANKPAEIFADKPIIVLPRATDSATSGAYFVGADLSFIVEPAGDPDYRGYLISLEPADDALEPLVRNVGPGKTVIHRLLVHNIGRDALGRFVEDVVSLSATPPAPGWDVKLSETTLRLGGNASREVELRVTAPLDAADGLRLSIAVTAVSNGQAGVQDRVSTVTFVRAAYGVAAWFDRPEGPKTRSMTFDADEAGRAAIFVRNTASIPDTVTVVVGAFSPEWVVDLDAQATQILELALDAGETREVPLNIRAPSTNTSQTVVEVIATSVSDSSKTDKVQATLRLRADINIRLDVAAPTVEVRPGALARFQITFLNRGSEAVGIRFNTTGALPDGWPRPVTRQSGYGLDEISGILPFTPLSLDLELTAPLGAPRGQRVPLQFFVETIPQYHGDPVTRESVALNVLVAADHVLTLEHSEVVSLVDGVALLQATIRNAGNLEERVRIEPAIAPSTATFLIEPAPSIPRGGAATLLAQLRLANTTPAGIRPVVLDVVSDDAHRTPWAFNLTVPERRAVVIVSHSPPTSIRGISANVRLSIQNDGNMPLQLPPRFEVPAEWTLLWDMATAGELLPGATVETNVIVQTPRAAPLGRYTWVPSPGWATGDEIAWILRSVELRAAIDETDSARIRVHNDGDGDAADVVVALERDGRVIDRVVLHRIPSGGNVTASFGETGGGRALVDATEKYGAPILLSFEVGGDRDVAQADWWMFVAAIVLGATVRRRFTSDLQ